MEYIKSQKNGKLLLCDGYRYRKDKARLNSTSWRCAKTGCKGRLLVTGENYKKATKEHNHGPDPASNEVQIVREKIINQLYHPKKGQGLLFKHAAVIFPKKLVSKFKVTMLQDVLYSVREIKFFQEIQPGIRIFQKLTLMKSTKKPTEGKIFCCTILVIMTTIESSCLARQEILHC
jgi:hypothetical protein